MQMCQAASVLGYQLDHAHPIEDLRIPCLSAGAETDRGLPVWFDVTVTGEGWQLRIDADGERLWQRCVSEHPEMQGDENLYEDFYETFFDLVLVANLPGDHAPWTVAGPWWDNTLAIARPIDVAALAAALREGVEAVAALHATVAAQVTASLAGADAAG